MKERKAGVDESTYRHPCGTSGLRHSGLRDFNGSEQGLKAGRQIVSLFCGAGGFDLGFERAMFSVAVAVDLRGFSVASYNHNRKLKIAHVADVTKLDPTKLDELAGQNLSPTGIIGGPPCQSFSRATRSSDDDPRHDLPLEFARLLGEFNSRSSVSFFAFENVPGLLKDRHRERYSNIKAAFDVAGFRVFSAVLNASWFGVPQDRQRLILVGFNKALYPDLKWHPPATAATAPSRLDEVIKNLPAPTYWARNLDRNSIKPHVNHWCMTPKSKKFTTAGALIVNRLANVTPDRRSKRTPGEHPFVRFSGVILPPRPMLSLSRRAERRSRTAALSAAARRACS